MNQQTSFLEPWQKAVAGVAERVGSDPEGPPLPVGATTDHVICAGRVGYVCRRNVVLQRFCCFHCGSWHCWPCFAAAHLRHLQTSFEGTGWRGQEEHHKKVPVSSQQQ